MTIFYSKGPKAPAVSSSARGRTLKWMECSGCSEPQKVDHHCVRTLCNNCINDPTAYAKFKNKLTFSTLSARLGLEPKKPKKKTLGQVLIDLKSESE